MVEQRNYLIEALEVLGDGHLESRTRLRQAAGLYWQAYARQGGHWPPSLRGPGDELFRRLTEVGPVSRTVGAMDEATVAEVIGELERFIELWRRTV